MATTIKVLTLNMWGVPFASKKIKERSEHLIERVGRGSGYVLKYRRGSKGRSLNNSQTSVIRASVVCKCYTRTSILL